MDALLDAVLGPERDAEQLDAVAQVLGGLDVGLGNGLDALDVDVLEGDLGSEGEAGQQSKLVRRVEAADVEGRVCLRVAEPLSLRQRVGEGSPFLLHHGQDEVRGTVEDAVDAADVVADERFPHGLDDRNATGDCRLEIQGAGVLFGERGEPRAMVREQRLVCGDDVLSRLQGRLDGLLRRIAVAAHQLEEDVDAGCARKLDWVIEPLEAVALEGSRLSAIAGGDSGDANRPARRGLDLLAVALQELDDARADCAEPGNGEVQWRLHAYPLLSARGSRAAALPTPGDVMPGFHRAGEKRGCIGTAGKIAARPAAEPGMPHRSAQIYFGLVVSMVFTAWVC